MTAFSAQAVTASATAVRLLVARALRVALMPRVSKVVMRRPASRDATLPRVVMCVLTADRMRAGIAMRALQRDAGLTRAMPPVPVVRPSRNKVAVDGAAQRVRRHGLRLHFAVRAIRAER